MIYITVIIQFFLSAHQSLMTSGHHTLMRNVSDRVTFEDVRYKDRVQQRDESHSRTAISKLTKLLSVNKVIRTIRVETQYDLHLTIHINAD